MRAFELQTRQRIALLRPEAERGARSRPEADGCGPAGRALRPMPPGPVPSAAANRAFAALWELRAPPPGRRREATRTGLPKDSMGSLRLSRRGESQGSRRRLRHLGMVAMGTAHLGRARSSGISASSYTSRREIRNTCLAPRWYLPVPIGRRRFSSSCSPQPGARDRPRLPRYAADRGALGRLEGGPTIAALVRRRE